MGAMRATLGLDMTQFETSARNAPKVVAGMADAMSRSFDGVRQSATGSARSFDELRASIDPAFAAQQRYAALQREVSGMVTSGAASQRAANIVLEQAAVKYMGIETASQVAARAQRDVAAAAASATRSYTSLRASIDPVFAATKRYEAAQEQLALAVRSGAISQAEANRVLAMAANSYLAPIRAVNTGLGRMGPAFVNAGFQVQDFAVQVAGGQSALLAFAQQLPQLLGVMGFAGKLAIIGSGLGVIAAVGGAVAMSYFRAGSEAAKLEERVDALTQAADGYTEAAGRANRSSADLRGEFGAQAGQAKVLYEALRSVAELDFDLQGREAAAKLKSDFEGLVTAAGRIVEIRKQIAQSGGAFDPMLGGELTLMANRLAEDFGLTAGEAIRLNEAITQVSRARGPQEAAAAYTALQDAAIATTDATGRTSTEMVRLALMAGDAAVAALRMGGAIDGSAAAAARENTILENRLALWSTSIDAAERQAAAVSGQLTAYRQQEELQNAIAQFGADSAQVEAVKRDHAIATAQAFVDQHSLAGQTAQAILDGALSAYDAQVNASNAADALRDAEAAAKGLAAAIAAAAGYSMDLDNGVVILQAKLTALQNQQNAANAGTIAGMRLRAAATRDAAIAAGELQVVATARYGTDMAVIDQQEALLAQIEQTTEANKDAASAAKRGASASEKSAKALANEADKWRDIIDPMNKYRRQHAELDKLLKAGALTKGEVQKAIAAVNQEMRESDPVLQKWASGVESAVDYMLDGFKDGFSGLMDIAKDTLKQLIAMFLKNQITLRLGVVATGSVSGAAAAATGGAGAGGSLMSGAGMLGQLGGAFSGFMGGITGPLQAGVSAAMQGGLSAGVNAFTATANASASGVFGMASSLGTIIGSAALGFGVGSMISGGFAAIGNNPAYANGLGTALGFAIGGPVGAILGGVVGGIVNRLFGRRLEDTGIQGSYSGGNFTGKTYEFYKGGLFASDKTKRKAMPASMAAMFDNTIDAIRVQIGGMAAMLGAAPDALDDFSTSFKLSLKGLSPEKAQAKIEEQFGKIANQMVADIYGAATTATVSLSDIAAGAAGGSIVDNLLGALSQASRAPTRQLSAEFVALQIAGEDAVDTLTRLSTALTSANVWMDRLGKSVFASSLAGGGKAWDFAEVFGGTDAMNQAVSAYYAAFYSDGERLAQARKELQAALNVLGINTLPGSNKAYRALVDQAFGAGDNTLAAKLIALAPAMAEITAETEKLTEAMASLYRQDLFATSADKIYAATSEGYRASSASSSDPELQALMREVVKAIREGDINNARLTTRLLALQERASLDPAA